MIAVFITTVAIAAISSMQPLALRTGASADYRGRAVAIAQAEAVQYESAIMAGAPLADITNALYVDPYNINKIPFRITTVTTRPPVPAPLALPNCWLVSVQVTWPGTVRGVTQNRVVTWQ